MKTDMIFDVDVDDALPEKQKNVQMFRQFLRDYARQGGVDSYPLKQLLDTHIDEHEVPVGADHPKVLRCPEGVPPDHAHRLQIHGDHLGKSCSSCGCRPSSGGNTTGSRIGGIAPS